MTGVKDKTEQTYKPPAHDHWHIHGRHEDGYSHHNESDHPESWNKLLKDRWYGHEHPHESHTYPDAHKRWEPKTSSWESGTDNNSLFVATSDVDIRNIDTIALDMPDCDSVLYPSIDADCIRIS